MEYQHIIEQWKEGGVAPFALYKASNLITDQVELVEARSDDQAPLIRKGEVISAEVAELVRAHHTPILGELCIAHVIVRDENGELQFAEDGSLVTEEVEIIPQSDVKPLTYVEPVLADEDDFHCDMCGHPDESITKIGIGWYCKTPRQVKINEEAVSITCFDLRIKQMGG